MARWPSLMLACVGLVVVQSALLTGEEPKPALGRLDAPAYEQFGPSRSEAEFQAALLRWQHGDIAQSEHLLRQIVERQPDFAPAQSLLHTIQQRKAQGLHGPAPPPARSPVPEGLPEASRNNPQTAQPRLFLQRLVRDPPLPHSRQHEPLVTQASASDDALPQALQDLPGPPARKPASLPEPDARPLLGNAAALDSSPIALHLDDVDVRKAIEILSRQGPLNILVSAHVTGKITANLDGLTFEQALDAILRLSNLVAYREKNLIFVLTATEMAQMRTQNQRIATRVYHLSYLRGSDFEKMCVPFLTPPPIGRISITPVSEIAIKSDTDKVGGDSLAGGEAVIIQDYESVLQTIDQIVAQLDSQPIQVLIEAVILEVRLQKSTDLGVNFAVLDGAQDVLTLVGNGAAINAGAGFDPTSVLTAAGQVVGSTANGFAENVHGLKFGFVDKDVTGFIRALSTVGTTNILACPRLLVLNKQRAELIIGDRIGYKTLAITETSTVEKVEFLNVGTQLRLRPYVANDGIIRMEIHPERSSGSIENGVPRTTTSEVTTNVMVPDGSTIVIGGLMEDEVQLLQSGIPVLSDLPWIGALFRRRTSITTKKELIVLLTPRTWNPEAPWANAPPQVQLEAVPVPSPQAKANVGGRKPARRR